LSIKIASAGSTKPGKGALIPIAGGFFRWNAMVTAGGSAAQLTSDASC
jgi:hypothetical protein